MKDSNLQHLFTKQMFITHTTNHPALHHKRVTTDTTSNSVSIHHCFCTVISRLSYTLHLCGSLTSSEGQVIQDHIVCALWSHCSRLSLLTIRIKCSYWKLHQCHSSGCGTGVVDWAGDFDTCAYMTLVMSRIPHASQWIVTWLSLYRNISIHA